LRSINALLPATKRSICASSSGGGYSLPRSIASPIV
jgi:hypothetical protein